MVLCAAWSVGAMFAHRERSTVRHRRGGKQGQHLSRSFLQPR